jgi:hypothetical protein
MSTQKKIPANCSMACVGRGDYTGMCTAQAVFFYACRKNSLLPHITGFPDFLSEPLPPFLAAILALHFSAGLSILVLKNQTPPPLLSKVVFSPNEICRCFLLTQHVIIFATCYFTLSLLFSRLLSAFLLHFLFLFFTFPVFSRGNGYIFQNINP